MKDKLEDIIYKWLLIKFENYNEIEYDDSIYLYDDGQKYADIRINKRHNWVNYNISFWEEFSETFSLDYGEFKRIMSNWIKKTLNVDIRISYLDTVESWNNLYIPSEYITIGSNKISKKILIKWFDVITQSYDIFESDNSIYLYYGGEKYADIRIDNTNNYVYYDKQIWKNFSLTFNIKDRMVFRDIMSEWILKRFNVLINGVYIVEYGPYSFFLEIPFYGTN